MSVPADIIIKRVGEDRFEVEIGATERRFSFQGSGLSEILDAIDRGESVIVEDPTGAIIRRYHFPRDAGEFAPHIPNDETAEALRDADEGLGLTRYEDFDDFARAM